MARTGAGRARAWRIALGLAVTAGFGWLAFGRLEWREVGPVLAAARPAPLIAGCALLALGYAARVLRWWSMLRVFEPRLPPGRCAGPLVASFAVNNVMPLRAGDLLRVVGFRRRLEAPAMRVLGTLVVERLLDLVTLLGFFAVGLVALPAGALPPAAVRLAVAFSLAALSALALVLAAPRLLGRAGAWLLARRPFRGRPPAAHARRWLDELAAALAVLRSPATAARLVGLSVLAWLFEGGLFVATARALGIAAPPAAPWFAMATGTLATLIPSGPGYVGTFHWFGILGLGAFGVDREPAAAFALLVHLLLWLPITLAGGAWLLAGPGLARLRRAGSSEVREAAAGDA